MKEQVKEIVERWVGDYSKTIDNLAQEICQLLEPKGEKPELLSPEEIDELPSVKRYMNREHIAVKGFIEDVRAKEGVKAQHARDLPFIEKARQEIFEELEKLSVQSGFEGQEQWRSWQMTEAEWQALKGVEE